MSQLLEYLAVGVSAGRGNHPTCFLADHAKGGKVSLNWISEVWWAPELVETGAVGVRIRQTRPAKTFIRGAPGRVPASDVRKL